MKIGFLIHEGFRSFKYSRQPAIITIVTIALSLLLLSFVFYSWQTLDTLMNSERSNVDVEIFLEEDLTKKQREMLFSKILQFEGIKEGRYINKDMAKQRFIDEFGAELIELTDSNPLPESVLIVFEPQHLTAEIFEEFMIYAQNLDGVWDVSGQSAILTALDNYQDKVYILSLVVFGILLFVLVVFISNTIKLSVYARRRVIETMYLVGATKFFIKMPFLIEGIVLGFCGSAIAITVLWVFKIWLIPELLFLIAIQTTLNFDFHIALLLTGMIIGFLGSFRAVQSYVK